ncbi:sensor domain-containing protein [Mycobacterium marinum]|uniref:sensor domain-containing protein n=1 Tax=Mycobacterium marinum TaxID=1781 RepID=UPI002358FBC3|nr:sensor domain-containing protein [Mycobacterium marinum]MDC8982044.1 sensor domain-containing protein [Mycobacterium marinum]MDC8998766.1 sensor domain-containing protein [Mycobacterium marinum]MDC9009727.1 sensor domain-containing protein [Mycobacterium marinum]
MQVTGWVPHLRLARGAMALAATAALALAGCSTTVAGTALPAANLGHAPTTTTRAAPRIVAAAALEGALLTQQQVVALVGGTNMSLVGAITGTADGSKVVDDPTCLGLASIGDTSVYANSGWVAMRGNQMTSPNVVQADVTQLLASFPVAADAAALLQRARQDWQGCANRRYGFHSSNGNHSYFNTGPVIASGSRIEVLLRQQEDPRWTCSHAMELQDSVLAEARVCLMSKNTTSALENLIDQVISRIPQ